MGKWRRGPAIPRLLSLAARDEIARAIEVIRRYTHPRLSTPILAGRTGKGRDGEEGGREREREDESTDKHETRLGHLEEPGPVLFCPLSNQGIQCPSTDHAPRAHIKHHPRLRPTRVGLHRRAIRQVLTDPGPRSRLSRPAHRPHTVRQVPEGDRRARTESERPDPGQHHPRD